MFNQNSKLYRSSKQTISLVLSGGGARGMAHIGVIEALEEAGYQIGSIAGCSMGALVGGIYARGKLQDYKEWICNLDRIDVFSLMDFTLSTRGFIKGNKVFQEIKPFIGDELIEDLPIPFACNAVNITTGEEKIFSSGSLMQAIRASAAIPTIIQPFLLEGEFYVDGGVMSPIPLALAKDFKQDLIIASDVNAPIACQVTINSQNQPKPLISVPAWVVDYKNKMAKFLPQEEKEKPKLPSFLDLMNLSFDLMQDRLSDYIIQTYSVDAVIQMSRKICGTFEFYRAKEIIDIGREQTYATLKQLNP